MPIDCRLTYCPAPLAVSRPYSGGCSAASATYCRPPARLRFRWSRACTAVDRADHRVVGVNKGLDRLRRRGRVGLHADQHRGVASAAPRLRVTPGMAPVTVLVLLSTGTPSTVSCASTPAALVKLAAELLTLRLPSAPEVLLTRTRREPCESVTHAGGDAVGAAVDVAGCLLQRRVCAGDVDGIGLDRMVRIAAIIDDDLRATQRRAGRDIAGIAAGSSRQFADGDGVGAGSGCAVGGSRDNVPSRWTPSCSG